MHRIRISPNNNFVIMDEFNGLLEHFDEPNHDTDALGRAIWQTLDACRKDPKIYFMTTVNRFDRVPQQIKNRLQDSIFEYNGFADKDRAKMFLRSFLNADGYYISEADALFLLNERFDDTSIDSKRSAESFFDALCAQAESDISDESDDTEVIVISRIDIEKAIARRSKSRELSKIDEEQISDEERRHQESINLSRELFDRQQEIHVQERAEDLERQERERAEDTSRAEFNKWVSVVGTGAGVVTAVAAAPVAVPVAIAATPYVALGALVVADGILIVRAAQEVKGGIERTVPRVIDGVSSASESCSIQ